MGHFTRIMKPSLFSAAFGFALLPACTSTELALGRNDAANPRAATPPLPALAPLSSTSDAQATAAPMPEQHTTPEHDMPAGMKMDGDEMGPMDAHGADHAGHTGMSMGETSKNEPTAAPQKAAHWTCTMHPSVDLPKPGKCPICGMKLVPKADDGGTK